MATKK
jgi:Ras-related protein Rab-7A